MIKQKADSIIIIFFASMAFLLILTLYGYTETSEDYIRDIISALWLFYLIIVGLFGIIGLIQININKEKI